MLDDWHFYLLKSERPQSLPRIPPWELGSNLTLYLPRWLWPASCEIPRAWRAGAFDPGPTVLAPPGPSSTSAESEERLSCPAQSLLCPTPAQPVRHLPFVSSFCCAVAQSCPTLCDPMNGSPPGSTVPGILQARIPEWVAMSFSNACMHAC